MLPENEVHLEVNALELMFTEVMLPPCVATLMPVVIVAAQRDCVAAPTVAPVKAISAPAINPKNTNPKITFFIFMMPPLVNHSTQKSKAIFINGIPIFAP